MDNERDIESFINDEPQEVVEAPVEQTAEERARDEKGRFAAKGVEQEEAPETVPPTDKLPPEEYKAIREEREKRQRAESELDALRQQVQQKPPEPPPSIWEDEQGWQQHFGSQIAQQAAFNARLDMSEMMVRQANPDDFEAMKTRFLEMVQTNPALQQQALSDPHPWAKAYSLAKNAAKMEELGAVDLADLEAKIEARLREEMQGQTPVPQPTPLPPSLTGERNVGSRSGPAWSGPPAIEDLLR